MLFNKKKSSADFFEMSKLDSCDKNLLRLDLSSGKVINSKCAELFNSMLKDKCGIDSAGIYFYTVAPYNQIGIVVWMHENEISQRILQDRSCKQLYFGDEFFEDICRCSLDALKAFSQEKYEILKDLFEKQGEAKNSQIFLYCNVISFKKQYLIALYGKTYKEINRALKEQFPQYKDFTYSTHSTNNNVEICSSPLLLFFKPEDLEEAKQHNHIDKMVGIVKAIIKSQDNLGLFHSDSFMPHIYSRRDLSMKIIEHIDFNNEMMDNDENSPFIIFGI